MKTFVLRVEVDETGHVVGVVERVRTGEKERFSGYAMLADVIRRMVTTDRPAHHHGPRVDEHGDGHPVRGDSQ